MFNKHPTYIHTQRFQRPTQRGNVLPSVAQYLQKIKTPEKEKQIVKPKNSPSYRIKSNPKINQIRQISSQSPNREKVQPRYNSFHSQYIKQKKKKIEVNDIIQDQNEQIQRRQKTEIIDQDQLISPEKNALLESQEIMLKLQINKKNTAIRRVKTEECDREEQLNSIRGTVQRQILNKNFENNNLLDLLLLSTIELKNHFQQSKTSRQVIQPKVKVARLSVKQFPKDFFC